MRNGTSRSVMTMIALNVAFIFIVGWLMMLLVGVIHGEWIAALPTVGFNGATVVIFIIRVITFICSVMYEIARDR